MIIVFDGPDGVGKTTQINLVHSALSKKYNTKIIKMPTESTRKLLGEDISQKQKLQALLFDWIDFAYIQTLPDTVYLLDRSPLTSILAYNAQHMNEEEYNWFIKQCNKYHALPHPHSPTMYIIFNRNMPYNSKIYDDFENRFNQKWVAETFMALADGKTYYGKPVYGVYTDIVPMYDKTTSTTSDTHGTTDIDAITLSHFLTKFLEQKIINDTGASSFIKNIESCQY